VPGRYPTPSELLRTSLGMEGNVVVLAFHNDLLEAVETAPVDMNVVKDLVEPSDDVTVTDVRTLSDALVYLSKRSRQGLELLDAVTVRSWVRAWRRDIVHDCMSEEEFDVWHAEVRGIVDAWTERVMAFDMGLGRAVPETREVVETADAGVETAARVAPPPVLTQAGTEVGGTRAGSVVGRMPVTVGMDDEASIARYRELESRAEGYSDGAMTHEEVQLMWQRIFMHFKAVQPKDQDVLCHGIIMHTLHSGTSDKVSSGRGMRLSDGSVVTFNSIYTLIRESGHTVRQFMRGQAGFVHKYLDANVNIEPRWGRVYMRPYTRIYAFDYADYVPGIPLEIIDVLRQARRAALNK
jgi:hypothetical protein